jgi:acetolactate synthase regulatory subunit
MTQEWTCLVCRRVLGVIRHRGMQRETKLVTTHHVRTVYLWGETPRQRD